MTYTLGMLALAVFAVTGVVAGGRKGMDILTIVILGNVTAIGGGTMRDIILDVNPIYWIADLTYLRVSTGASIAAFFLVPKISRTFQLFEYADGLGLAMFAVLATEKTLLLGFSGPVAVLMGMITGISGGMLRDILTARMPLLFGRELYATPVIVGCSFFCRLPRLVRCRWIWTTHCHFSNFRLQGRCHPVGIVLSGLADLRRKQVTNSCLNSQGLFVKGLIGRQRRAREGGLGLGRFSLLRCFG